MPKAPRAAKVLRSAWIPAPPPESLPAMVRAFGLRSSIGSAAACAVKVVPSSRLQWTFGTVALDGHEPGPLHDLADVREGNPEPLVQGQPGRLDPHRRHRRHQLVVLASTEIRSSTTRAPTPDAAHSRDRSRASPSDTSIMAEAPCSARVFPSPTRATGRTCAATSARPHSDISAPATSPGRARASASPPADAPSEPVTTTRSPARAPLRVTNRSGATSPTTATDTTATGPDDRSPPTSDSAYSSHAERMPLSSSTTQAGSSPEGMATETSA